MLDSEGPVCAVVDPSALPPEEWKRLYEREHVRAEAAEARIAELEGKLGEAEARAEEWRQESVSARCDLNVLRSVFASNKREACRGARGPEETAPEPEYARTCAGWRRRRRDCRVS